jgi:hypothetical protein
LESNLLPKAVHAFNKAGKDHKDAGKMELEKTKMENVNIYYNPLKRIIRLIRPHLGKMNVDNPANKIRMLTTYPTTSIEKQLSYKNNGITKSLRESKERPITRKKIKR